MCCYFLLFYIDRTYFNRILNYCMHRGLLYKLISMPDILLCIHSNMHTYCVVFWFNYFLKLYLKKNYLLTSVPCLIIDMYSLLSEQIYIYIYNIFYLLKTSFIFGSHCCMTTLLFLCSAHTSTTQDDRHVLRVFL